MNYRVFVNSRGNVYMSEIAQLIVAAFKDLGKQVELVEDELPVRDEGSRNLVIAPHEFFELSPGITDEARLDAAEASVLVATEQPGTRWFEVTTRYCYRAPLVLDINRSGTQALRARGINARHLQIGYHSSWDAHEDGGSRPVDVLFMGSSTPRREEILASLGRVLSDLNCKLLLFRADRPVGSDDPNFFMGASKHRLLAKSKILLNLHRASTPYLEWVRFAEAIHNGCVVLTEPSTDHEPLVDGTHFIQAPRERLADTLLEFLDGEQQRLRTISKDAYDFVRHELPFSVIIDRLIPAIDSSYVESRLALPPRFTRRRSLRQRAPEPVKTAYRKGLSSLHRMRFGVRLLRAGDPQVLMHLIPRGIRAVYKQRKLDELGKRRQEERSAVALRGADPTGYSCVTSSSFARTAPEVSVVIPLYNYAEHIEEAILSVADSRDVSFEVIVVDDASSDDSVARVRALLDKRQDLPLMAVEKSLNEGLPTARNVGIGLARAPLVFLLDADNLVYPDCLRKLAAALEDSDAAFVYPIIEVFGARRGLLSQYPWDPQRLAERNYIDAMSLIRKSAWEAVGGFSTDLVIYGLEDYALWHALDENGYSGTLVPEILARYRDHAGSMIRLTRLESAVVFRKLREMYPNAWVSDADRARGS